MPRRIWFVVGALGLAGAQGARAEPVVREEHRVQVDGVSERWRLEWRAPPVLACFETEGVTCPCEGFAQGESGQLDFVRSRPGAVPERVPLTPLFGADEPGQPPVQAVVRGWAVSPRDAELPESQWARALEGRARVRVMMAGCARGAPWSIPSGPWCWSPRRGRSCASRPVS